jgi:hypothetical protein
VHCYRSDERRTSLVTHVLATIVEDWGRPTQRVTRRVLGVEGGSQELLVARIQRR